MRDGLPACMEYLDVEQIAANTGKCSAYQHSVLVLSCAESNNFSTVKIQQYADICPLCTDSCIGQVADYTGVWFLLVKLALQEIGYRRFITSFAM